MFGEILKVASRQTARRYEPFRLHCDVSDGKDEFEGGVGIANVRLSRHIRAPGVTET